MLPTFLAPAGSKGGTAETRRATVRYWLAEIQLELVKKRNTRLRRAAIVKAFMIAVEDGSKNKELNELTEVKRS